MRWRKFAFFWLLSGVINAAAAGDVHRLVFGSFKNADNADRWAEKVSQRIGVATEVDHFEAGGVTWHRVVSEPLSGDRGVYAAWRAEQVGLEFWRLAVDPAVVGAAVGAVSDRELPESSNSASPATSDPAPVEDSSEPTSSRSETAPTRKAPTTTAPAAASTAAPVATDFDVDLGFQARSYRQSGAHGQSRFQPSVSASFVYRRAWDDDRSTFTMQPFARLDGEDDDRSHADLRQFFMTRVGDDWDLHVGVRQVFWGVTEFVHLVDIVNQTDLVENIDGEDKLGQPMVNLSLVRGWGVLDFFVMTGFRERTFPGKDGRLRTWLPIDDGNASFESSREHWYVDGAVRWQHAVGPFEFGVHQFHGTNRDPKFLPALKGDGSLVLQPHYTIIDQTGLDALLLLGNWAWKLETISRKDDEDGRFWAATGGFERTLVGFLGTRADLGLVVEYVFDDRGKQAQVIYENDLALATRWRLNDAAESQALVGVVWDVETDEYIVKLEASRWLGLEGRVFGGADEDPLDAELYQFDGDNKTGPLQRDDFLQLEVTRYF
jgi:hypothetical protein